MTTRTAEMVRRRVRMRDRKRLEMMSSFIGGTHEHEDY